MNHIQRLMEAVQSLASLLSPDAEQPYLGEMVDLIESAKARIKALEGANDAYQRTIDFDQLQAQQETIGALKNEIKLIGEAINDPRVDLTMTMSEVIMEMRHKLDAQQAEIDSLMLEFCPNEMTPEQLAEWGSNQRAVFVPKE